MDAVNSRPERPKQTISERSAMVPVKILPIVRYMYYVFVFSIPIETLDVGLDSGMFSVSKLIGVMFIAVALLQPAICFQTIPRALWYFSTYGLVCLCVADLGPSYMRGLVFVQLFTLCLMLILFWISYNLLRDRSVVKGALIAFIGSCAVLTGLMLAGAGQSVAQGRTTALSQNANVVGATLSLGWLALFGLTYGRDDMGKRTKILIWCCLAYLAIGIVATGSRAAMLASLVGILLFVITKRGDFVLKARVAFIGFLAIAALGVALSQNEAAQNRWERAMQGDQSRREEIHPAAWAMFLEKPLLGWGPVSHYLELGARFGKATLDPHSIYLWVLIETGLLGSIPFFIGLWICWRSGWRATYGSEGPLPITLLASLLIVGIAGTVHMRKVFWIMLAYNLASESFISRRGRLPYGDDRKD